MSGPTRALVSPGRTILFANVAHFYSHFFMLIYPTAVLVLGAEFGLPYGKLLTLLLPGYILFGVAALPAGWLGDRWNANAMMAIFFLGTGAAAMLTGLAAGPLGLAAGLALMGLFASIYHPVGTAMVVANAANRGRSLGLNGVCGSAGVAGAPLITGALAGIFGWRAAFVVPGAVCALTGVAFLIFAKGARGGGELPAHHADSDLARAVALRGLGILAITSLSIGLMAQSLMVGLPKAFEDGVSMLDWAGLVGTSGLVTAALLFSMVGQYVGGHLADRYRPTTVYAANYLVMAPVAVLATGLGELPLVGACALLLMLTSMGLPAENSLIARYCPAGWRATAYGVKFVLALGVASLAVPMVGFIYDATGGFYWVFMTVAGFAGLIAACGAFLPPPAPARAIAPAE